MARPRLNPTIRFADVAPIWDAVENSNGGTFYAASPRDAIKTMHRMNLYRKALRDYTPDGLCPLDRFVVRVQGAGVLVEPRPIPDMTRFVPAEGAPLEAEPQPLGLDEE